jgi:hypothetical protein
MKPDVEAVADMLAVTALALSFAAMVICAVTMWAS